MKMENEIFERDYRRTPEEEAAIVKFRDSWGYAVDKAIFKAYHEVDKQLPKCIAPEDKAAYEDLLPRLDVYAKTMHGKIRGVVDYEKWEAYIFLDLPHFEACTPEKFKLLTDMAKKAFNVTFSVGENGMLRLEILIEYFRSFGNPEDFFDESAMPDDTLMEMLGKHGETEEVLSDLQMTELYDMLLKHFMEEDENKDSE